MLDETSKATLATIDRFNDAFNRHDVDGVMACMTDDCLFDSTPAPDGKQYRGQASVRGAWEELFRDSPHAQFEAEEITPLGDRCLVLWQYHWVDAAGAPGHVRGVDIFRVRDNKVAEKLVYVKG